MARRALPTIELGDSDPIWPSRVCYGLGRMLQSCRVAIAGWPVVRNVGGVFKGTTKATTRTVETHLSFHGSGEMVPLRGIFIGN